MFDGLKDKLEGFTSDVEEDADVDPEAVDQEVEAEPDGQEADEKSDQTDEAADDAPDAADAGAPTEGDGAAMTVEETGGKAVAGADADTADEPDDLPGAESTDVPESADERAEEDRGLAERAKLFASGKTVIDEDDLQKHLDDLELALLSSDVELSVTEEILDRVEANLVGETRQRLSSTGNLVRDALREALYDVISVGQFDFEDRIATADKPVTIVFTGVNGVGKTTTIAKLSHWLEERGYSTVLANGDTYRAGANEQLREHAENLDRKLIAHEQGSDPAAVIYDAVEYAQANDVDVVLGDTAGRLHTSDGLMDQLSKIDRVIEPDMTLFVDEAVAGQDAVNRAREFDAAASVDGSVLTKADADPQGGAAISIAHVTGKPILFLGTGQDYDDVERFDPEWVVDELLGES